MTGKTLAGLAVAATLFVSFCIAGSVDALKKESTSTRRVVIDGKAFVPDDSTLSGGSLLERELGRLGIPLPDGIPLPAESGDQHPAFSGRLKDSPSRSPDPPPLPAGLIPEHTLRMEGTGAPVDLVFGKMGTPGPSIRLRLVRSGWKPVSSGTESGVVQVLQSTGGKETAVVCLDEAEGTFLHFREGNR